MTNHLKSWREHLGWCDSQDFYDVMEALETEEQNGNTILPERNDMFKAFSWFHPSETKVVILGQDPYPTRGHAHGLAFSVKPDVHPIPKSLQKIYAELRRDYGNVPNNGCLAGWARQGVLLLNMSLSVREGESNSHKDFKWSGLITKVIELICQKTIGTVFILWGERAKSMEDHISVGHHVITSAHPSSSRSEDKRFKDSKPFTETNINLENADHPPIMWEKSWSGE